MNILICRWDIFVYPDILDTMKNEGHLCDVLDFSAIKMSDEDIASFSKVLEDKLCEKTSEKETKYDAVFSVNFFIYSRGLPQTKHPLYMLQCGLSSFKYAASVSKLQNQLYIYI